MAIAIILTVMAIIGWMVFVGERSKKEVSNVSFVMIVGITWISYYGLSMDKSFKADPSFMNLLVFPMVLLLLYYIRSETKPKEAIKILATRQGYWDEITEDDVRKKYVNRLIHKTDRIEALQSINLLFYRIVPGAKLITGNLFLDIDRFLKRARYTYVKEIKEIEKYPLYNIIFKKVKGFVAWREIKVDYEQLLKSNDNNLEFFIMDCWELYTQGFNIGTANMEVLATRSIEWHLINALDAIDMESIRREAAPLFYAYMQFKGRLPEPESELPEVSNTTSAISDEDEDFKMSQPTTYEYVQERIYRPDRDDFKSLMRSSPVLRFIIYVVLISAAILALITGIFYNSLTLAYGAKVTFYLSAAAALAVYMSRDRDNSGKPSNITKNEKNKKFMLRIGNEVEKFYGDARRSNFAANILRPVLLDAEKIKRHGLISATIGAGKTVLMKGLIEQQAILGGGGLAIDGKGTIEFAKEVYGLFKALGREKDFIHINFLDMDATHTINPLQKGSALAIYEILIALLQGEENEWKAKQKEYMKNVIKLLVWRRDHEKLALDFSILAEYMTLEKLVNDAITYRDRAMEFAAIEDFVQFVSGTLQIDYRRFLIDESEEFFALVNSQKVNNDLQGVYDASMSAQAWRGVITNLKSDYGRVFNTQTPDISMWEAVQRNKFIFVTLPTMASDTTPKELGRLILGLIKGVAAEKAEKSVEPEIPFLVLPDEIGSYIIDGFGRLMSKSRALGISIWPIYQSKSQIDAVGKIVGSESTEYREMMDVVGTHIIMKNINPAITEEYNKMLAQKKYIERDYIEKRHHINAQIGAEDHFRVEKEEAIKHTEVVNMNNGEMIVVMDGQVHRAIAAAETTFVQFGKKTSFEGRDMIKKIPLTQYLPKKEFFRIVNQYYTNKRSA